MVEVAMVVTRPGRSHAWLLYDQEEGEEGKRKRRKKKIEKRKCI